MKIQASLEFLIILGAISLLSLSTITLYKGNIGKSDQLLSNIITVGGLKSGNVLSSAPANPQLLLYLPENSTLNKPSRMEVAAFGCDNGSVSLSISSPSLYFPQNSVSLGVNGISTISVPFTPLMEGFGLVNVSTKYRCHGALQAHNFLLTTYSINSSAPTSGRVPTAYIQNRNESVVYPLLDGGKLESLTEFSHCTYASMFGPTGIERQCGTSNAWSYSVFSSYCYSTSNYYTATICIVPSNTSHNLSSTDSAKHVLKYSFKLGIVYNGKTLYASISNNSPSNIFLANDVVGSAQVNSAANSAPSPDYNLISDHGIQEVLNPNVYSQYLQAKNNLYSTLSFYNQSYVSPDIQSSIESAVSAYIKASNYLINSTKSKNPGCSYADPNYVCNASSLFSYQINAILNRLNLGNTSISYLGSTISVISK